MARLCKKDDKGWDIYEDTIEPTSARPTALALAQATLGLIEADRKLKEAEEAERKRHREMDYDPFGPSELDWAKEQEEFNRAADAYEDALTNSMAEVFKGMYR